MYKYKLFISVVALTVACISCSDRDDTIIVDNAPGKIAFVSGLNKYATRLCQDGSQWLAGDRIGVYMLESGKTTVANYSNVPYEAESSAQTTVFKATGTTMSYPDSGSAVDFVAYYPYSPAITGSVYPVDLANQSTGLAAHDLLYAKADNGGNGFTEGRVSFAFAHRLSKITVNFTDESGHVLTPDADGIIINGMNATAGFDLKTGMWGEETAAANIIPYQNGSSFQAVLLPFTVASGHRVTIMVDGNKYVWIMNNKYPGLAMKAGYSYTFNITVKTSATEVDAVLVGYDGSSIAPWGDGAADNREKETTEDIEIPAGYEKIELPAGGSVASALSGATSSKVAIVLANSGTYEADAINVPASVTSLIIAGKGGATAPSVYLKSAIAATGNMDLIRLYNLDLNGIYGTSYAINQSEAVVIEQISIENCTIHDIRGVVRLQKNASTINLYKIENSIFYNINTYSLLTVDAGSVLAVEISKSTFYNLAGRGIYLNVMPNAATAIVDQCTFNLGPKFAVVQFSSAGGSLSFTNNIVGLPYDTTRGVSAGSNATTTSASGNYYVSDTTWAGNPVGTDCGYTAAALFANPGNGDFTQSKLTAGDPRWYKQ